MLVYPTVIVLIIPYVYSSWTQGPDQLPRADDELALGYDAVTDTILIFGGGSNMKQFVTFKNHHFTDVNIDYLTESQQTWSAGQHFTQIGNDLWMIRDDGGGFIKINTESYTVSDPLITIPTSVSYGGCLTETNGFLIVIGGGGWSSAHNKVQIYNLDTSQWLSGVPSLTEARMSAACVAINNKVYAISGYNTGSGNEVDTIEELDVTNLPITSGLSWNTLPGTLASGRSGPRAVIHGTDIYVIGGDTGAATNNRATDVNVIDTLSGNCQVVDTLAFGTSYASSIIVNNVLYSFGGWIDSGETNKYQYNTLPDLPTESPITSEPTRHPTKGPIRNPSETPTKLPTKDPTTDPSDAPTRNPSEEPSKYSSEEPSKYPTKSPSDDVSASTANNPTALAVTNLIENSSTSSALHEAQVQESTYDHDASSPSELPMSSDIILNNTLLLIIGLCSGCVIICCAFACYKCLMIKKNSEIEERELGRMASNDSMAPQINNEKIQIPEIDNDDVLPLPRHKGVNSEELYGAGSNPHAVGHTTSRTKDTKTAANENVPELKKMNSEDLYVNYGSEGKICNDNCTTSRRESAGVANQEGVIGSKSNICSDSYATRRTKQTNTNEEK